MYKIILFSNFLEPAQLGILPHITWKSNLVDVNYHQNLIIVG